MTNIKILLAVLVTSLIFALLYTNKDKLTQFSLKNTETIAGVKVAQTTTPVIYKCTHTYYATSNCQNYSKGASYEYFTTTPLVSSCYARGDGSSYSRLCVPTNYQCGLAGTCKMRNVNCCNGQAPVYGDGGCSDMGYCGSSSSRGSVLADNAERLSCGRACTSDSACSNGLACINTTTGSFCWGSSCTADPEQRIRVQGRVLNCLGQPVAGVPVTMFADTTRTSLNSTTTDMYGNYGLTKGYKSTDGVRRFALMAGKDSNSAHPNYFGRVQIPSFLSPYGIAYSCAEVNCNYRQSQVAGGQYRENYHLGWNWTTTQFRQRVVHGTVTAKGFDFKQVNCQK